jgi:hypothetical protein
MVVFETMFFTSFTSASCFSAINLQLIIVFTFKIQRFYSYLVFYVHSSTTCLGLTRPSSGC